jgi:transcriptional regulator with XRE-family HTH domain
MNTRIQKILNDKGLTQGDLINNIEQKYGVKFTRSYVSKICSGLIANYTIRTALILSETLGVKVHDIVDTKAKKEIVKKAEIQAARKEKEKLKDEANSHPGVVL